jgi:predicted MFS family arabinose efflux permease
MVRGSMMSADNTIRGLRCGPREAFVLLVLLHFTVDFYGGLPTPILEPTLTTHLRRDIGAVAALIGGWALLINVVQPLSGGLLPRRGLPGLLVAAPLLAALTALIGLTPRITGAAALLFFSALGIGILHPEAALAVHSLSARRAGAAVGLFMAAGYFGFAIGGMAGGLWAEAWGLRGFWLLGLPAVALAAWALRAGLHRIEGHIENRAADGETERGLPALLALAIGVATIMCLLVRLVTLLLVRRFPEAAGQGWGGVTVFATGITGAIGAFLWGMMADRRGPMRVLAGLHLAAVPFLGLLLWTPRIGWAPVWGLGLGATIGSAFPLVVVRARRTRGFSPRLRLGLTIGGAWGSGEVAFIFAGRYLDRFPAGDPRPVEQVLALCGALMIVNAALAWRLANRPTRPVG